MQVALLEWPFFISADLFAPPECLAGGYFTQALIRDAWHHHRLLM